MDAFLRLQRQSNVTSQHKGLSALETEKVINFCGKCGSLIFGGKYGEDTEHTIYAGTFVPEMSIFT